MKKVVIAKDKFDFKPCELPNTAIGGLIVFRNADEGSSRFQRIYPDSIVFNKNVDFDFRIEG